MTNPLDPLDLTTNPDDITSQVNPPDPMPGFAPIVPAQPPPVVVVHQQPAGRGRGKNGPAAEPKTKLQQSLPSPERVKIEKRRADGHKAYIGHYSWAEVQRYGSFELFLQTVVVPKWKGGEYELTYVRADKSEQPHGTIIMEEPPIQEQPTQQVAPLSEVLRLAKELQRDVAQSAPAPVDPVEQMSRMMALQKQMGGGSDSGMMMALMMMNRPEPPRQDPMESAMRLLEMSRAMQPPPPPPMPLPPMPMGPDPMLTMLMESQRQQMQMMVESSRLQAESQRQMFEAFRHQEPRLGPLDILSMAKQLQPADQIGPRDILPMITTMKDLVRPPEKDGLREHLEAFRLLRHEIKELTDDGRPSGFREFTDSILPEGIESITKLIQTVRGKEAAAQEQLSGPPPQTQRQQMPQVPPGFADHAKAINKAKDPTDAMGAALNAMFFLGQSPDFRPSLETLIGHARSGQQDEALDLIKGFLEGIGRAGLITQAAANMAMQGFEDSWDDVAIHLTGGKPVAATQKPAPKPKQQAAPAAGTVIPIVPIPGQPITPPAPDGKGSAS